MGTKVYDNALDLITFSRNSGGTSLRKISYGDELFDPLDFTSWTDNGGVSSKTENSFTVSSSGGVISPDVFDGSIYLVSISFTKTTSTSFSVRIDGTLSSSEVASSTDLTGTLEFTSIIDNTFYLRLGAADTVTINSISVKEVLFDQPDGTLQLFYHPADIPRIDYSPDGTAKGLLIEEQRTNLVTYSNDFDTTWVQQSSVWSQDAEGPYGQANYGWTITDNNAGGTGSPRAYFVTTLLTSTQYVVSCYMKADQLSNGYIQLSAFGSPNGTTYFDLSSGSVLSLNATHDDAFVEDVGNGWYRCSILFTSDASDTTGLILFGVANGTSVIVDLDGTSSILIYGAQLEAGAFPTSYIPTSGSTVTRADDVASIPVSAFGYNQSAGTLFVEFGETFYGTPVLFHLNDGSDTNRAQAKLLTTLTTFYVQSTGDAGTFGSVNGIPTSPFKVALALETNNHGFSVSGSSVGTMTSQNIPISIIKLNIGSTSNAASGLIYIKSIQYFPRRLTNAQLQELTT